MPTAANLDNATVQIPLMSWEELKRQQVELQAKIDQLEALLREGRYTTPAEVKKLVKSVLGARRVIGYAISHLSPSEKKGWPVGELRQFVDGLEIVDNGDPDVRLSVGDFRAFADEIDQAEAERKARTVIDAKPAGSGDDADAIVERLLKEAEDLTKEEGVEAAVAVVAAVDEQISTFEDKVRDVGGAKLEVRPD